MELLSDTVQDLHPITVHFPIALLIMSAGLSIILYIKPNAALQQATWVLLWVGTVSAVVSSIAGLISHVRYEETAVYGVIETHQNWSFGVTGLFIAVTIWRWLSRKRQADAGTKPLYLIVVLIGVAVLTISGLTGGDLVYDYGINVRGINPLLEQ